MYPKIIRQIQPQQVHNSTLHEQYLPCVSGGVKTYPRSVRKHGRQTRWVSITPTTSYYKCSTGCKLNQLFDTGQVENITKTSPTLNICQTSVYTKKTVQTRNY